MERVKRIITIGTDPQCNLQIICSPTLNSYIKERLLPIHCQIIEFDNGEFRLIAFSDYVYINGCGIGSSLLEGVKIIKIASLLDEMKIIKIDFEDHISIGIDLHWQQWFCGFGLNCDNCKYHKYSLSNDKFCNYCKKSNYNPGPYKGGYSNNFDRDDYFNYASCDNCGLKPDWCCECTFHLEAEPKNRSWKEHIAMYNERLQQYENKSI